MTKTTKKQNTARENADHLRGKAREDYIVAHGGFVCVEQAEREPPKRPPASLLRRMLEPFKSRY